MKKFAALFVIGLSCAAMLLAADVRVRLGRRVEVGGHSLRLLQLGQGSPTVVFESGAGGPLEVWSRVQPQVSKFTDTVAYDRAGIGRSEPGPVPRDAREIVRELHRALQNAHIPPPYILVGHSLGGPYARVFAGLHPHEVVGMVLVDPSQEELFEWQVAQEPKQSGERKVRLTDEVDCAPATFAQARASRIPAGVPVVLITAMGMGYVPEDRMDTVKKIWEAKLKFHKGWVEKLPNARHIVTDRSGHLVPYEEPQLVIDAIREVVEQAKQHSRL